MAVESYNEALTSVWGALSDPAWAESFWRLDDTSLADRKEVRQENLTAVGRDVEAIRSDEVNIFCVDKSFCQHSDFTRCPFCPKRKALEDRIAFLQDEDVANHMGTMSSANRRFEDRHGNVIYLCKRAFKASVQDPLKSDVPSSSLPGTLNRCLYFVADRNPCASAGGDSLQGELISPAVEEGLPMFHIAGTCISSSCLLQRRRKGARDADAAQDAMMVGPQAKGMAKVYMTSNKNNMQSPFMVVFNSRYAACKDDPEGYDSVAPTEVYHTLHMLGRPSYEDVFHATKRYVPRRPRGGVAQASDKYPWMRSLGETFWDTIMPVPHMKMYRTISEARAREFNKDGRWDGAAASSWEMIGNLGDVIHAYAVHLRDGSIDFVLARSGMIPIDKGEDDTAEAEKDLADGTKGSSSDKLQQNTHHAPLPPTTSSATIQNIASSQVSSLDKLQQSTHHAPPPPTTSSAAIQDIASSQAASSNKLQQNRHHTPPCKLPALKIQDITRSMYPVHGSVGLCTALGEDEDDDDDAEEYSDDGDNDPAGQLLEPIDSSAPPVSSTCMPQSTADTRQQRQPAASASIIRPSARTAWWGRPVVKGD